MIYERIVELCKEKGTTVKQLERDAGLSNGSISKWRECSPMVSSVEKVAKALDVPIWEILKPATKEVIA